MAGIRDHWPALAVLTTAREPLVNELERLGSDGSGTFTTVTATGAIQGATIEGTTSITTPSHTVTAGGDGSLSLLASGALATFTLLSSPFSAGMTVSSALSQASILGSSGAASIYLGGVEAAASSVTKRVYTKTGIADNTATSVITVTVPNATHAAAIKLTILAINGPFESSRCAEGLVILARKAGVNVVAAVASLALAQIATVAAGTTLTLAYGVSAVTGAVGASNTFDIQVTIDDSGNTATNQVIIVAELINSQGTGVSMAASA